MGQSKFLSISRFFCSSKPHRVQRKENDSDLYRELKKAVEQESVSDAICRRSLVTVPKDLEMRSEKE